MVIQGGSRFDPQKSGSATDGAEKGVWSGYDPTPNGWAPRNSPRRVGTNERAGRPEIWVEMTFTTMQSVGRSGAPDTGRHAFRSPGDWKRDEMEMEEEFESALEDGGVGFGTGRTKLFLLSFIGGLGGRRSGSLTMTARHLGGF